MAVNPRYISYPLLTDSRVLAQKAIAYLQAKIPGWAPSESDLATWMIEAISSEAADIGTLSSQVPKTIFRYYGAKLFGVDPIDATYATGTATVYATDVVEHTITAGMQVSIADSSGNQIPFTVLLDVIIPAGIGHADVLLVAVVPGSASSGVGTIGGVVNQIDIITWVDHITLAAPTAGGQDAELDDQYLDRLSRVFTTVTPTPIHPSDFAILAQNVAGVQRSTAIDGYNPDDSSFGNEKMVCVISLDAGGVTVSGGVKTDVSTYLQGLRELNFVVKTADATVSLIDVTVSVTKESGYSDSDISVRVNNAIATFLNPAIWGIAANDDPNSPRSWLNKTTIYYLDLANAILNVAGVLRISSLTLGLHSGALSSADYVMTGVAPIPNADVVTVNVT